jgi:hypothetical protein
MAYVVLQRRELTGVNSGVCGAWWVGRGRRVSFASRALLTRSRQECVLRFAVDV